ncbi:MAG: HAD family phosphatase [Puniceicoccales bacterium]|jgi:HAD superfamily hydrolase (TIGR01509 family)|nr:HAD family phosphatase [Puniceicoccales bacterium]
MLSKFLTSKYAAFIFDCDGTIADNMGIYYRAWNRAIAACGGREPIGWEAFRASGGRCLRETVGEYNSDSGSNLDPDRLMAVMEEHVQELLPEFKPIVPVVELIRREKKRPMAVASAGRRESVEFVLDKIGIRGCFKAVVTREDVRFAKPAPDLFLKASELIGVEPKQCIVFEDSPLGEEAAKSIGMACHRIPYDWWDPKLREG